MTVTLSNSNSYRSLKRGICRDKYCSLYNWSILCHVQLSDQDPEYIRRLCIIPQISVHPSKKAESGSVADKGVGVAAVGHVHKLQRHFMCICGQESWRQG